MRFFCDSSRKWNKNKTLNRKKLKNILFAKSNKKKPQQQQKDPNADHGESRIYSLKRNPVVFLSEKQ